MNALPTTKAEWHARAKSLRYETRHFIDGAYVDSLDGARLSVINPATGVELTTVAAGSAADIDRAVQAAKRGVSPGASVPGTASMRAR